MNLQPKRFSKPGAFAANLAIADDPNNLIGHPLDVEFHPICERTLVLNEAADILVEVENAEDSEIRK